MSRNIAPPVDLSNMPLTYLLLVHLTPEKVVELKEQLRTCKCPLTDTPHDASLFIADVGTQKRCELELRKKDIAVLANPQDTTIGTAATWALRVVKLEWFTVSLEKGKAVELEEYTIAVATVARRRTETVSPKSATPELEKRKAIRERDIAESPLPKRGRYGRRAEKERDMSKILAITKRPPLLRRSTSSFEEQKVLVNRVPGWVRTKNTYSCCRSSPLKSPNDLFIAQLKAIRHSRIISSDVVGTRAYSTAIAAVKAYPYPLRYSSEIQALPGCGGKIASLFGEWKESDSDPEKRVISAVKELEQSQVFRILKQFESIWGVGPDTAAQFYYTHNLRSIGDVISQHWSNLSRLQQIGVKYYDELLTAIPRSEMERVAARITSHATRLISGIQSILVGGYRRGKMECHDVDVLFSHPVEGSMYSDFLMDLLRSLENSKLITHTLFVSTPKMQHVDPHRPSKSGFDTLDKALIVWQRKKGRLHRRVDIVIAPTISAGTALLGWTGGTTFERDLRLFCEKERGWKFSSEGVWRGNERVPGTEGWRQGENWEDIEKRIMETVGIGWKSPGERCTG